MPSSGITIVVKGPDSSGRTMVVRAIMDSLGSAGFSDVKFLEGTDFVPDFYSGPGSIKDIPILINEVKTSE